MFSSSTICTFVFGRQILCLRIFHTVLSGCLLNKYAILSISNSLARFHSIQYMVLFSNSHLSCLINYVYIYVHLYIVSSDIFQNPCSSMNQSNNSLNHSVSSISSIALPYILYKLFNYIDVWWCEFPSYRSISHHRIRTGMALVCFQQYFQWWIQLSFIEYILCVRHSATFFTCIFPPNSQKSLPFRYWKHSFTNKNKKIRNLPNIAQSDYIFLKKELWNIYFISKAMRLYFTFSLHFECPQHIGLFLGTR